MNCIDCRYSLLKDGHYNCTYEEGECIKINVLEKENAKLENRCANYEMRISQMEKCTCDACKETEKDERLEELEAENAELKEDLRNKKLAVQNRNGRIKELEEKISVLLYCKNCLENKGGYICKKEYEDKCLTQKIQFIKEFQEEIAELKGILNIRSCQSCRRYNRACPNDGSCNHYSKWEGFKNPQLTKAKEIIRELLNSCFGYNSKTVNYEVKVKAEQFLEDVSE